MKKNEKNEKHEEKKVKRQIPSTVFYVAEPATPSR
jgi:hypothetical protein